MLHTHGMHASPLLSPWEQDASLLLGQPRRFSVCLPASWSSPPLLDAHSGREVEGSPECGGRCMWRCCERQAGCHRQEKAGKHWHPWSPQDMERPRGWLSASQTHTSWSAVKRGERLPFPSGQRKTVLGKTTIMASSQIIKKTATPHILPPSEAHGNPT